MGIRKAGPKHLRYWIGGWYQIAEALVVILSFGYLRAFWTVHYWAKCVCSDRAKREGKRNETTHGILP